MFTNPLPDDEAYLVHIAPYAQRHFIKRFAKDYPGKRWKVTLDSIREDLKRVRALAHTGQVDELRHQGPYWLFKYDFAVALSKQSPKASGNRGMVFLDSTTHVLTVLVLYGKGDLPKNRGETEYLNQVMRHEFDDFLSLLVPQQKKISSDG